jgi:hypothetical protein
MYYVDFPHTPDVVPYWTASGAEAVYFQSNPDVFGDLDPALWQVRTVTIMRGRGDAVDYAGSLRSDSPILLGKELIGIQGELEAFGAYSTDLPQSHWTVSVLLTDRATGMREEVHVFPDLAQVTVNPVVNGTSLDDLTGLSDGDTAVVRFDTGGYWQNPVADLGAPAMYQYAAASGEWKRIADLTPEKLREVFAHQFVVTLPALSRGSSFHDIFVDLPALLAYVEAGGDITKTLQFVEEDGSIGTLVMQSVPGTLASIEVVLNTSEGAAALVTGGMIQYNVSQSGTKVTMRGELVFGNYTLTDNSADDNFALGAWKQRYDGRMGWEDQNGYTADVMPMWLNKIAQRTQVVSDTEQHDWIADQIDELSRPRVYRYPLWEDGVYTPRGLLNIDISLTDGNLLNEYLWVEVLGNNAYRMWTGYLKTALPGTATIHLSSLDPAVMFEDDIIRISTVTGTTETIEASLIESTDWTETVVSGQQIVTSTFKFVDYVAAPNALKIINAVQVVPRWTAAGDAVRYSLDMGSTWQNSISGTPIVTGGAQAWFASDNRTSLYTTASPSNSWFVQADMTNDGGTVKLEGDLYALLDSVSPGTALAGRYAFNAMFQNCNVKFDLSGLVIAGGAESVLGSRFQNMFSQNLIEELPAGLLDTVAVRENDFSGMFSYNQLTTLPLNFLPSTATPTQCYASMFLENKIASLPAGFNLPGMALGIGCYGSMFKGNLLTAIPLGFFPTGFVPGTGSCQQMFANNLLTSLDVGLLCNATIANSCFAGMFSNNKLTTLPVGLLPLDQIANQCYTSMFTYNEIASLPAGFTLPALTLRQECYRSMFAFNPLTALPVGFFPTGFITAIGCCMQMFESCAINTLAAGLLDSTNLSENCFFAMFRGNQLTQTTPHLLKLTVLAKGCYEEMFANNDITSLVDDVLPAITMVEACYRKMFLNNKIASITEDALQGVFMASACYYGMFQKNLLVTLPDNLLKATQLAYYCYGTMFDTNLITTLQSNLLTDLPLTERCYYSMFSNNKLTSIAADFLRATTLQPYCYALMFSHNSTLNLTPYTLLLPAPTLVTNCYAGLFQSSYRLYAASGTGHTTQFRVNATAASGATSYMFASGDSLGQQVDVVPGTTYYLYP